MTSSQHIKLFKKKKNEEDSKDIVMDFICFLLRYSQSLQYEDFTDDPFLISRIKREERFRSNLEIEEI